MISGGRALAARVLITEPLRVSGWTRRLFSIYHFGWRA